jgi:site-specific DNA recombinase
MEKTNVALYVRVSTEEQAEEGYSIEAQLHNLRNFCKAKGFKIVKEYKDEGISAKSMKGRYGLNALLNDSNKGVFSLVLVWKLSRLSRDQIDLLDINKTLEGNNVGFMSMTESFDTATPSGRAMFQMLGLFAEFERNQLAENVRLGMKQKARQGQWNGGALLGYDCIDGKLIENEQESFVVKKVFDLYCQGKGLKSIANKLNHEGHKTKKSKPFSLQGVRTILHNPTYIGKIRWCQYENWSDKRRKGKKEPIIADGLHQAIISNEVWDKAQSIITQRTFTPSRLYTGKFSLAGFLKCPRCSASMVGTNHSRKTKTRGVVHYRQYVCGNFHTKGSSVCSSNMIKAEVIEEKVLDRLVKAVQQPEMIREVIRKVNLDKKGKTAPLQKQLKLIEKELSKIESKMDKLFQLVLEEVIDSNTFKERKTILDVDQKRLEEQKNEILMNLHFDDDKEIPEEEILNIINDFANVYAQSEIDKQKLFLKALVKDITLTEDKDLKNINLNFQFKIPQNNNRKTHHKHEIEGSEELPPNVVSHLFMIRFPPDNPERPINLLHQQ